jgi:hypothetical protein
MAQQQSPWLETAYGWAHGENGWNTGMDSNLLKFSVLFDHNVDGIAASLPAAVNGQVHFLTTDNRLYFSVGAIYYSTPVPKWFTLVERTSGNTWQFNGVSLVEVDSPLNVDSRLDTIELELASLGTAAFEDVLAFATPAQLDLLEAQQEAYTDTLRADLSNTSTGASNVGYAGNTVAETLDTTLTKISSLLYASEFGLLGDGSDETVKVRAAVDDAISTGKQLYWEPGEFIVSADIAGFYSVHHLGVGVIKDGGSLPLAPTPSSVINLYVATTGNDSNVGLTASRPFATVGAAIAAIPPSASGSWTINIAAGTYPEGLDVRKATNPNLNITIQGPMAAFGAQTAIFEGVALGPSTLGIYAEDLAKVTVKHVAFRNFVRGGVYFAGCLFAQMENVKVFRCGTAGRELVRAQHAVLVVTGCQLDGDNASLNGFVCYHGFMSVLGATTVTKCTGAAALYAESAGGHFDTNIISNCARGLYALQGGFPTISGGSITSCSTSAIESDQGSYIVVETAPSFSGNGVNVRQTVSTGIGGKIRDDTTRTALFANNDAFEVVTQGGGAFMMQLGNSGLTIPGGGWNTRRLILGAYHLWIDASGRLRIKSGAPASDTDGTVVGTQS